jgi:glycerol-3-phosphate cytidylyltransferase
MKKYKVGLFPMVGDLLHLGHILALEEAKEQCEKLIVAINTHPEGKLPVQSVMERVLQAAAVMYVDQVIVYQGRADMDVIAAMLEYHVRFVGDDYRGKEWDGKAQENARGIEPYFIDRSHGFSSTELKQRVVLSQSAKERI